MNFTVIRSTSKIYGKLTVPAIAYLGRESTGTESMQVPIIH